jgi:hypothetical protein
MGKESKVKADIRFCLFGTNEQRILSMQLIEEALNRHGIDISDSESQNSSTSDEALPIGDVVVQCEQPDFREMEHTAGCSAMVCRNCDRSESEH